MAVLLLAALAMIVMAGPASAHARLVSTTPAQDAVLAVAPAEVVLRFSQSVRVGPDAVRVVDPEGRPVGLVAPPKAVDRAVTAALPAALATGSYAVQWRVISDDGHPIAGRLTFAIVQPGVAQGAIGPVGTSGTSGTSGSAAGAGSSDGTGSSGNDVNGESADGSAAGLLYGMVRALAFAAFALLVGSVAVVLLCWPGGRSVRWVRRIWVVAGSVSVAVTVAAFLLQGPYLSGRDLGSALDPAEVATTLSLPLGIGLAIRLVLLVAVAAFLRFLVCRPYPAPAPALLWAGGGLAIGLALTWSVAGHAATGPDPVLGIPVDALHLTSMGVWLGGLVVVAGLCRAAGGVPAAEALAAVQRFSALALGSVALLVATGCYSAVRQVGSPAGLVGTEYGRLLMVKLAVVALAVAAAAVSRQWAARLRLTAVAADAPVRETVPRGRTTVTAPSRRAERRAVVLLTAAGPGLRRSVLVEVAAAVLVIGVTAALVGTEPARTAAAEASEAAAAVPPAVAPPAAASAPGAAEPYFSDQIPFGSGATAGLLQVAVEPVRVGTNTVVVLLTDPAGNPVDVAGVHATLALPYAGIAGVAVPLERLLAGHQHGQAQFSRPGRWQLSVAVQTGAAGPETVTAPIVIGGA